MILRNALSGEEEACYRFIEDARAYHHSLGFEQWHPDYPTLATVTEDISKGIGFAFTENGKPIGYCCIVIGDEPAYRVINGKWKTDREYAVVHRMAFGAEARGNGLSRKPFRS